MARITAALAGGFDRLAFLDTIAYSEIGPEMLADPRTDDGYKVIVGSTPDKLILFDDYAHHPHKYEAKENSTGAGRYQFIWPTWTGVCDKLRLPDFSPISQDKAGLELARGRGAFANLDAGNVAAAIYLCSKEWASFPGSPYGQRNENSPTLQELLDVYKAAFEKYKARYDQGLPV